MSRKQKKRKTEYLALCGVASTQVLDFSFLSVDTIRTTQTTKETARKMQTDCLFVFSFSASGAGQQCCYSGESLMVGPPGAGSLDVVSPEEGFWGHMGRDVLPWFACCKFTSNCGKYYERRPSDDGSRYIPPPTGKSHFITRIFIFAFSKRRSRQFAACL